VQIEVLKADAAQIGNVDGSVDIYFEPLPLPGGKTLPLHTPTEHIDPHISGGQASTKAIADTVEDIVIPYHYLYHVLRKGMEVDLHPGTQIRARTAAVVAIGASGQVVVTTPPPFDLNTDKPATQFKPAPYWAPPGVATPSPKPSPTASPTPLSSSAP